MKFNERLRWASGIAVALVAIAVGSGLMVVTIVFLGLRFGPLEMLGVAVIFTCSWMVTKWLLRKLKD